jgi:hypothetical protein
MKQNMTELMPGVTRRVLIPVEEGQAIFLVNTCYAEREGLRLIQMYSVLVGSDTFGQCFLRRSEDNGRHWSGSELFFTPEVTPEGTRRLGESCLFRDDNRDTVILFHNLHLYPQGHFSGNVWAATRLAMRFLSREGNIGPLQILVQNGYDETHWAEGVIFGRNCLINSFCAPVLLKAGTVLLPVVRVPLEADLSKPYSVQLEAGCLMGEWRGDQLKWTLSAMVGIDTGRSSRGLMEPTMAELGKGSILMVCRGSNSSMNSVPGHKWRALSHDGGRTWSDPEPFTFDDGEPFFSPSSGSRLIRNSRSGRLYWIGNISTVNPDGNGPRYPLHIAEVDEVRCSLRRTSVRIIDDRQPNDDSRVMLSNFRVYEDRETGDFVLHMARIQARFKPDGALDMTSPSYEYRIGVEGTR